MIIFFSATLVVLCMYRYAHVCTQIYLYMYVYLLGLSQIEYCKTICHGKFLRFLMDLPICIAEGFNGSRFVRLSKSRNNSCRLHYFDMWPFWNSKNLVSYLNLKLIYFCFGIRFFSKYFEISHYVFIYFMVTVVVLVFVHNSLLSSLFIKCPFYRIVLIWAMLKFSAINGSKSNRRCISFVFSYRFVERSKSN